MLSVSISCGILLLPGALHHSILLKADMTLEDLVGCQDDLPQASCQESQVLCP